MSMNHMDKRKITKTEIRQAYDCIDTTSEVDARIRENVLTAVENASEKDSRKIRGKFLYGKMIAVAAVAAICVGIFQIPSVSAKAEEIWKSFTNRYIFSDSGEIVEMTGKYIPIHEDASKEERKYDTIADVEKELGIDLLESPDAYTGDSDLIGYSPYLSDDNQIYGVYIQDQFYLLGDLQNVETYIYESMDSSNEISYDAGDEYKSPVSMEIYLRGNGESTIDYEGQELECIGVNWELNHAQLYKCENLGINIVLDSIESDGIAVWRNNNVQVRPMSTMYFVYDGVEYRFFGEVSLDTMKEIAENLK